MILICQGTPGAALAAPGVPHFCARGVFLARGRTLENTFFVLYICRVLLNRKEGLELEKPALRPLKSRVLY